MYPSRISLHYSGQWLNRQYMCPANFCTRGQLICRTALNMSGFTCGEHGSCYQQSPATSLLSVTEWQRVIPSTANQQDAWPLQGSAFKTHLFEDECQAERDYVPFLDALVLPSARQIDDPYMQFSLNIGTTK